jgi:sialic acid synthase SpsE
MIFGEVGPNHNGKISYAKQYINFHKKTKFNVLMFQIREPKFYKRDGKNI